MLIGSARVPRARSGRWGTVHVDSSHLAPAVRGGRVDLRAAVLDGGRSRRCGTARRRAPSRRRIARAELAEAETQIANAYQNQLELPVLFYVLTILAIITRHADFLFVVLAWVFVVLRLLHVYIHLTSNRLARRFAVFAAGAVVLAVMWAIFIVRLLVGLMTPAARLSAAIEVVADIEARRRPAADALKDWGLAHRFAGSGDRAAIAGLVYDALRRRASSAFLMGDETPARRAARHAAAASASLTVDADRARSPTARALRRRR